MKSRKVKLPFFTPRLTAFLLFLSMLLSVLSVFPSSVYAVATESDPITEQQPLPEETLSLPEQTVTTEETEFENFAENTASVASAVVSSPVIQNAGNTTILHERTVDMTVGEEQGLRVRTTLTSAQNVTFSVNNPQIVSIVGTSELQYGDAYATIRANKEGTVVVTAKVKNGDTVLETVSMEIYVVMADGIYQIKSCATHLPTDLGDYYLRFDGLGENGLPIIHASTNAYGDMTNNIYRYWKTEYKGNGKYAIRPLVNDSFSLVALGTYVTALTGTPEQWIIRYRGGGYEIMTCSSWQNGEGMVLSTFTPQTGQYSSIQYYYYADPTMFEVQNMAFERWQFIPSDISGVYFRNIETGAVKETLSVTRLFDEGSFTLAGLGYTVFSFGHNSPTDYLVWSTSSSTVATVDGETTKITPQNCGTAIITVRVYGTQLSTNITVTFKMIEDGTYFLRNLQTGLYGDIQNGTMSSGNEVEQQTFDGANTQKWLFTHIGSNVYTIRSTKNSSYYLGIQNDSTADGANIVLRTGTVTNGMKWKVEKANQGYKIVSYSDPIMVLCTYSSSATAGQKLILSDYENNTSYRDEWFISPVHSFALMALDENGQARNAYFEPVHTLVDQYFSAYVYEDFYSSCSKDTMKSIMSEYSIFVVHTHGSKTGFYLSSSNPLSMSEISGSDLSNLKFALLLTCNTGKDYSLSHITNNNPQNIIEQMVICGAETVVGFNNETYVSDCNRLAQELMTLMIVNGYSIERAIREIDFSESDYDYDMSTLIEIAGNRNFKIR